MVDTPALLNQIRGMAVDLLFPKWCVGCGKEGNLICPACLSSLPRIARGTCVFCGRMHPPEMCPDRRDNGSLDGLHSPFRFDGAIRESVYQLKYHNLRALAPVLSGLLYDYLGAITPEADMLVPVPLHHRRLRERGYNQAGLLAQGLGKRSGIPFLADCLVRERYTPAQARTEHLAERRDNVRGVFSCRDRRVEGKSILLVDDVATSGATLSACTAALKEAGAGAVRGLTLAREF